MSMHFNNRVRNRLFALTLVCCNTERKRKYCLELDADWLSALVVQLSIMRGQKKAARPYRDPKYFTKFLNILRNSEIFYEIPKFFSKNKKYFAKFEKNLGNSKKICKKPKKFCKKPKNFAKF